MRSMGSSHFRVMELSGKDEAASETTESDTTESQSE